MTDLVPADRIEQIVGVPRHGTDHIGRAVSAEETVYILHSRQCLDTGRDLRKCVYSLALDDGINLNEWTEDAALRVAIVDGRLVPVGAE